MTTNYTDTKLTQALAKMLPETVKWITTCLDDPITPYLFWINTERTGEFVEDTELLHLCWLVEETITDGRRIVYLSYLCEQLQGEDIWPEVLTKEKGWLFAHATWQQRVIDLAKVKGVEIL